MKERGEKVPHLVAVLVGNDGASLTYVGSKVRSCKKIGFESTLIHLPEETTEKTLLQKVQELNDDADILKIDIARQIITSFFGRIGNTGDAHINDYGTFLD